MQLQLLQASYEWGAIVRARMFHRVYRGRRGAKHEGEKKLPFVLQMNIKEGASFFPPFVLMLIATGGTSPALY